MSESKRILITGVSRGLGRAMARGFAELGHSIAGCARNHSALTELQSKLGQDHHFTPVDLSNDEAVKQWAGQVLADFGCPDLLINNAAVINRNAPLWEQSAEEFNEITSVNINSVANVIRHFVPAMIGRGRGLVVNFSSGWGRSTAPEVAPYCASKWAIEGLTQALAQELPVGLGAVAFNPGVIDTDMLRSCYGEHAASYPDADEWSKRAVPFLLSVTPKDNGHPLTCP